MARSYQHFDENNINNNADDDENDVVVVFEFCVAAGRKGTTVGKFWSIADF